MKPRGEAGVATVELAFVFPVLFLFLFGGLQMGLFVVGRTGAAGGARDGARYASLHYLQADVVGSTDNAAVVTEVLRRSSRTIARPMVAGSSTCTARCVAVQCVDGATGSVKACSTATVGTDVVRVTVRWDHLGVVPLPFLSQGHVESAQASLLGLPS